MDASARITDEGIARMRTRIGVVAPKAAPFNSEATVDGFRHFANGYGDNNPLYCDPAHGLDSPVWRSIIGPPLFLLTMGESEVSEIRPEIRAKGAHALAGVHEFLSGNEWEWFLPVKPGDRIRKRYYLYDVEEKRQSSFTDSRTLITRYRNDYVNQDDDLVAVDRSMYVRAERDAAAKTKKYFGIERPSYTDEEIAEVDSAYASEFRRGRDQLSWNSVEAGADLPTLAKGPLALTDVIAFMRGWGAGVNHSKLAWDHRRRHPNFFNKNGFGAWDVVERVHWEEEWARKIGNPGPYDFGRMRMCYLSEIVTNWLGDNAWLWKLSAQFRRFNYIGDLTWVKGNVVSKSVVDGLHVVELDIYCENHRGEITAPGSAVVVLPADGENVQLPKPSDATEGTVPLIY